MPKATGRWTAEEHDEFLKCLDIYGREWKKVAERITTRTAAQIRSHAQKYFKKIEPSRGGASCSRTCSCGGVMQLAPWQRTRPCANWPRGSCRKCGRCGGACMQHAVTI